MQSPPESKPDYRQAPPKLGLVKLELITREGCHLCEAALASIRRAGLEPELVDVDAHDDLRTLYDFRVPVLLVDGRVVAEGIVDGDSIAEQIGS